MPHIELPRALEDYFAFAETDRTRDGRRFSITLPYLDGTKLDRLQWWWQVTAAQEQIVGSAGIEALRQQSIERFRAHIERWLANTGQRLYGDEPIPRISPLQAPPAAATAAASDAREADSNVIAWRGERVANG